MKKVFFTIISAITVMAVILLSACSADTSLENVNKPDAIASADEVHPSQNPTAVEESNNVNGMHFTTNLEDFTSRFNLVMMDSGGTDYIYTANWKKQGDVQKDVNGIEYQLWYYHMDIYTITASVETSSEKIMNLGCGTTMSNFVMQENGVNNSDKILHTCAVMAAAVGGFNQSSLDVLQDIFYRTTFEGTDSLWYEGNIFSLTTKVDNKDNSKSTMMFRVFPISDKLKTEWNVTSYESFSSSR